MTTRDFVKVINGLRDDPRRPLVKIGMSQETWNDLKIRIAIYQPKTESEANRLLGIPVDIDESLAYGEMNYVSADAV